MAEPRTLVNLFEESVRRFPDNPMFWEKTSGSYKASSYRDMHDRVRNFACGLMSLGVVAGDKVALLAQARQDWVVAELGILYAGAVNVPLSVKLESADLLFRLKHGAVKVLVVSGYQYAKVRDHLDKLPDLKKVILLDPSEPYENDHPSFGSILSDGVRFFRDNKPAFEAARDGVKEDHCALISYTSGTTADPKGIMLSHKNLYVNCRQSLSMFKVEEDFRILLILPLDHSFAHTTGMYVFLTSGASLASVQLGKTPAATLKNVFTSIREVRPNTLLSVPAVAKNLRKNIEQGVRKKGMLLFIVFNWGLKLAYKYQGIGWNRGKGPRILLLPLYRLFDALVFRQVRKSFGGNLKYFVGGGALLDIELQRFFFAIGIPMYQGYGLSETAPVISSNTIEAHKMGSSGRVVPDLEVKICNEEGVEVAPGEQGEIVVRGENVMLGYYRNEEATREVLKDGWLFTGDLGYFDRDGFLFVLGRHKSLLIGDDGEKYSPEGIEEYIEEHSKSIAQIMIYNNQNSYTTALLYPRVNQLNHILKKRGFSARDEAGQELALKMIRDDLETLKNAHGTNFPVRWLPTTFAVLPEGFTEENHLLNSSLKMVRGKIVTRYQTVIESMYSPEGRNAFNSSNKKTLESIITA